MAQSKLSYKNYLELGMKKILPYFTPHDNGAPSFNDSCVVLDLEHHLTLTSTVSIVDDNTDKCITAHKCTICLGIPREPVLLANCGHIFCESCIRNLTTVERHPWFDCPNCRLPGNCRFELFKRDRWPCLMRQVWDIMRMRCYFCKTFVGSPVKVVEHERLSCEKRLISCNSICCDFIGTFNEAVEHALNCEELLICCVSCNYITKLCSIEKHDCDEVKKRISALPPNPKRRIRKSKPGNFGHEHEFTWAIETQLFMEESALNDVIIIDDDDNANDSEPSGQAIQVVTGTNSPITPTQAPNTVSNMQTPTSTPILTSTPNSPRQRRRPRSSSSSSADTATTSGHEIILEYIDAPRPFRRSRRILFDN